MIRTQHLRRFLTSPTTTFRGDGLAVLVVALAVAVHAALGPLLRLAFAAAGVDLLRGLFAGSELGLGSLRL